MPLNAPPPLAGSFLVVELTSRCSLACVHCAVSDPDSPHHERTGHLDPALFDALLDDLAETGARFDSLVLFWLGEPLLHPHFGALYRRALRLAERRGTFGRVEVHTNGTHLDDGAVATALNDAETEQLWVVTLDAATAATFRRIKGRDRLDRVRARARRLLERKAELGARRPRVALQFIVSSRNEAEAAAFRDEWLGFARSLGLPARAAAGHLPPGDDVVVFFRQLDCPTPEEQQRENDVFRRVVADLGLEAPPIPWPADEAAAAPPGPCASLWKSPAVGWDGRLTTCVRDLAFRNALGSLRERRFSELWWGPRMAEVRRRAAAGGEDPPLPECRGCFVPRSLNHARISDEEIAAWEAWEAARA